VGVRPLAVVSLVLLASSSVVIEPTSPIHSTTPLVSFVSFCRVDAATGVFLIVHPLAVASFLPLMSPSPTMALLMSWIKTKTLCCPTSVAMSKRAVSMLLRVI